MDTTVTAEEIILNQPGRFDAALAASNLYPLTASGITTLQMNLGKRCNLACRHCHVQAGPHRIEQMTRETMEACVETL
ncbi:MAG: radical SAM protein, partial [Deltaproteobacteria bacterium]|nr:radical SAM protein [Deltaproteobacteria bacterium]